MLPRGRRLPQGSRVSLPPINMSSPRTRPSITPPRTRPSTNPPESRANAQSSSHDSANAQETSRDPAIFLGQAWEELTRGQSFMDEAAPPGMNPSNHEESSRQLIRAFINDSRFYPHDLSNDIPSPPSFNTDFAQEEYADEAEVNRNRKRKRLGSFDNSGHRYPPYGHKGQVVPGLLQLDVIDVNTHEGNTCKDARYQANILRRSWSIYATQTDHCDVILAHKEKVPFSLTKIVVKVPTTTTYRAPIGEGLIFVAMSASEFKRTVHYRLHSPEPEDSPESRSTVTRHHYRPPSRRADNPGNTPRSIGLIPPTQLPPSQWRSIAELGASPARRARARTFSIPATPPRVLSPPIPDSEYQVRAAGNMPSSESEADESSDESDASTASERATPERRSRARSDTPRPTLSPSPPAADSDDEDEAAMPQLLPITGRTRYMRAANDPGTTDPGAYVTSNSRRRRLRLHKERELDRSFAQKSEGGEYGQSQDHLLPQGRFTFERGKTRVSVRFEPPVSGKYILLKLWSKNEDQSIDIQNVSAYGFVGQRFFPSVQAR